MAVAFAVISVLGIVVFFKADDWPVGLLFIGLTCIYVSDFFASLFMHVPSRPVAAEPGGAPVTAPRPEPTPISEMGERALGFFHLITGGWLMYLTFAVTLNLTSGTHLWL
jgi:hypothetical protein